MKDLVKFMITEDQKYEIEMELRSIYSSIKYFSRETGSETAVADLLDEVLEDFGEDREIIVKTLKKENNDINIKLLVKFKDALNDEINDFIRLMDGI